MASVGQEFWANLLQPVGARLGAKSLRYALHSLVVWWGAVGCGAVGVVERGGVWCVVVWFCGMVVCGAVGVVECGGVC